MGAPTFSITDGTTTITLNSGSYYTIFYSSSRMEVTDPTSTWDTGVLTESLDLMILGGNETQVKAAIRAIEALVISVFMYHNGGTPVYIQIQYDTDSAPWRAKLYNASLITPNIADELWKRQVSANLTFVRDVAWEGAESEIPISAAGQAAATGGRSLTFNTTENYISIAANVIEGTLPAFTRLTFQNTTGGSRYYRKIYVGNNAFSSPGTFLYSIQGENFTGVGTSTANGNAVGGLVSRIALPVSPPTTVNAAYTIPGTTILNLARGRRFNLLMKSVSGITDLKARVVLSNSDAFNETFNLWKSIDLMLQGGFYFNFGSIPFPPSINMAYSYRSLYMGIKFWRAGGGNLDIDYLFLMGTDSFMFAETPGHVIYNNDSLEFDSISGAYTLIESGERSNAVFLNTEGFRVFPSVEQRIHVLVDDSSSASILHTASVRLYYRPRRLTI